MTLRFDTSDMSILEVRALAYSISEKLRNNNKVLGVEPYTLSQAKRTTKWKNEK